MIALIKLIYDNINIDTLHWYETFSGFTKNITLNTGQRMINYNDNSHDNHNFCSLYRSWTPFPTDCLIFADTPSSTSNSEHSVLLPSSTVLLNFIHLFFIRGVSILKSIIYQTYCTISLKLPIFYSKPTLPLHVCSFVHIRRHWETPSWDFENFTGHCAPINPINLLQRGFNLCRAENTKICFHFASFVNAETTQFLHSFPRKTKI